MFCSNPAVSFRDLPKFGQGEISEFSTRTSFDPLSDGVDSDEHNPKHPTKFGSNPLGYFGGDIFVKYSGTDEDVRTFMRLSWRDILKII